MMNGVSLLQGIGVLLVIAGLVWMLYGDKDVSPDGAGIVMKLLYARPPWVATFMKWFKWPMGAALVYAGVMFLLK